MKRKREAVFIDRDGVINHCPDNRYITDWSEFRFLPGSVRALKQLKQAGKLILIISNQACVGRGLITHRKLQQITRNMLGAARAKGAKIDAVYYCIHRSEEGCSCRKPKPGMLHRAGRRFPIDWDRSFFIGDHETDIQAGQAAGLQTILVLSGRQTHSGARRMPVKPDWIVDDLRAAAKKILSDRTCR